MRDQFKDEQAKIHWALSFMNPERAALYANSILRNEAARHIPSFLSWRDFEGASLLNSAQERGNRSTYQTRIYTLLSGKEGGG